MSELLLAPMQGLTDAAFRLICFEYGCDGAVTEMIETGTYATTRKKLGQIEETLCRLPGEKWLSVQLIGKVPREMAVCAERVTDMRRFDAIEVNMGCPARKVVTGGSGCALMGKPETAREILRAVKGSTDLPVHLKIRLGWDEAHENAPEIAEIAREEGVSRLTVHGRTRTQFYGGEADCEGIRRAIAAFGGEGVANGGVKGPEDVRPFLEKTGAERVSIGRAALTRPWIFEDARRLEAGKPLCPRDAGERCELLLRHAKYACLIHEERTAVVRMRKFTPWYLDGLSGLRELQAQVNRLETLDGLQNEVGAFLDRLRAADDLYPHAELTRGTARLSLPG